MLPKESLDSSREESVYSRGAQLNRYPFEVVVGFVFRYAAKAGPREDVDVLEVGCCAGNNLWRVIAVKKA